MKIVKFVGNDRDDYAAIYVDDELQVVTDVGNREFLYYIADALGITIETEEIPAGDFAYKYS